MKDLNDLNNFIKKIWPHSETWRLNGSCVEFSILCSDGTLEWFNYALAPVHVEKYINAWIASGGINNG